MNLTECDQIYRAAWATRDPDEFRKCCLQLLPIYPVLRFNLSRETALFWRARIADQRPFVNLRDMYCPPSNLTRAGRFNRVAEPCFYLSSHFRTALHEVTPQDEDLVQFAGFRLKPEVTLNLLSVGELANVFGRGFRMFGGESDNGMIIEYMSQRTEAEFEVIVSMDKFFTHVLADENARDDGYMKTQTLAQILRRGADPVHGIAFPSVRDPYGQNFAIDGDMAELMFQNTSCFVRKLKRRHMYGMNEMETIAMAHDVTNDGTFLWGPVGQNVLRHYGFTSSEAEKLRIGVDPYAVR